MKSIGLSDEVYIDLLNVKHDFEKQEGRVISYDEIIKKLIDKINNYQPNKQSQIDKERKQKGIGEKNRKK